MSATVAPTPAPTPGPVPGAVPEPRTAPPERGLVLTLARVEARRLLLHPLTLFGTAIFALNGVRAVVEDGGPREAFETIDAMLGFYPGVLMILVGGLVATRDLRAGSREMLGPVPGRLQERTLAFLLASLAPATVGLLGVLALHGFFLLDERYLDAPGVGNILQGPALMLGGTALGLMVSTWAPSRSTAVLTMVVMVAGSMWLNSQEALQLFAPVMLWASWGATGSAWAGTVDGSPAWHVVYVLGLTGMAACGALLRVAERRRPVVLAGLVAVAVTVLAGIGQLP